MVMIIGNRVHDYIDIRGNDKYSLSVSTIGAQTSGLEEGVYDISCDDSEVYIKISATTASDVTSTTGYTIRRGNTVSVLVRAADKIGAILASGTGTLYYQKVG